MKLHVRTFGCQMNFHDSSRILGLLCQHGFEATQDPREADVIIVNTCSVREKAWHKAVSEAGRFCTMKRVRPETVVVLAGCVAEQEGERLRAPVPEVDLIVGPDHYRELPSLIAAVMREKIPLVITGFDEGRPEDFLPALLPPVGLAASQFITIMKGCSHHCAYCIVPRVRGPERCREPDDIVREAEMLVQRGAKELMLLGQKVNGYQKGKTTFTDLLARLNEIPGLSRLRFTSPHPKHMTPDLIEAMGSLDTLCESIHLPLQSGSDRILEAMRRHYTADFYREVAASLKARSPRFLISTDLIVGFPGETEADFEETLRLYEEVRFAGAFSFKYSPRPGTYAATHMADDVPPEEKARRLDALHAVINRIERETRETLVGRTLEVLVEGPARKGGQWTGRARNNQIVNFSAPKGGILGEWCGKLLALTITRAFPHCLEGHSHQENGE